MTFLGVSTIVLWHEYRLVLVSRYKRDNVFAVTSRRKSGSMHWIFIKPLSTNVPREFIKNQTAFLMPFLIYQLNKTVHVKRDYRAISLYFLRIVVNTNDL